MRSVIPFSAIGLCLTLVACDARPLAGPDVQPVALVAAPAGQVGPLIFVDGRRLPPGTSLAGLRASAIERIEVVKAAAAVKLYGEEARAGVIQIYTKAGRTAR